MVVHRLAAKPGIRVPPTPALRLADSPYTTFLAQRFDRTPQGIRLSPAYAINPVPDCTELTLAINETDTHCDVDIAMQAHRDYGLSNKDADDRLNRVTSTAFQGFPC